MQSEAVPESLRNMLLVMQASGALIPPQIPEDRSEELRTRWDLTLEQMNRFLPGFLFEVIPPPVTDTSEPSVGAASELESVEPTS
jgi:golgi-specific brefeldin A-resistance guanine nucleotide exchange factor 1